MKYDSLLIEIIDLSHSDVITTSKNVTTDGVDIWGKGSSTGANLESFNLMVTLSDLDECYPVD